MLDKACKINRTDPFIPVKYQFTWFCLHKVQIQRKQPSGRLLKPLVTFSPVYVEKKKQLLEFLKKAIEVCGSKEKFSELICYSPISLNHWLNMKSVRKAPITAYMKAAQLLNQDIWEILNNTKLYGKTSPDFIVFKKKYPMEINDIRIWIETEGTLLSHQARLQIRQSESGLSALNQLSQKFKEVFGINPKYLVLRSDQEGQFKLYIESAVVRQILCLQYDIPLGYKAYQKPPKDLFEFNDREEGLRKLTRYLETEGCFTFSRKSDHINLVVTFGCRNKERRNLLSNMLMKLGYRPKKHHQYDNHAHIYSVGLCGIRQTTKLLFEIFPYFWHVGKIRECLIKKDQPILLQRQLLSLLRFKPDDKLIDLIQEWICIFGNERLVFKFVKRFADAFNISIPNNHRIVWYWQRKVKIPLFVIFILSSFLGKNCLDCLPKYVSLPLWLNDFCSLKQIEKIRGKQFKKAAKILTQLRRNS